MKRLALFLASGLGLLAQQSLVVTGGPILDNSKNDHVLPMPIVANPATLKTTGCTPGEMAFVISANAIYENSTTGGCTWQSISSGSGGGGLADPGSNGIVYRSALNITQPATAANVIALFGACTGVQYLGADSLCHTPGGGGGGITLLNTTAPLSGGPISGGTGTISCPLCIVSSGPFVPGSLTVATGTNSLGSGNLSGDGTTAGTVFTLKTTVNATPGVCGDATHVAVTTTNSKGLVTNCVPVAISGGGGGGGNSYVTSATTAPQTILQTTHLQGINANVFCFSGAIVGGATTGHLVSCDYTKNSAGDVTVSWGGTTVASIQVFSSGAGPVGTPGTPGGTGPTGPAGPINQILSNGSPQTLRPKLNVQQGTNVTVVATDNGIDTTTLTINSTGGGGGGTPGGTNGQSQYNNSGAFGGYTMSGDATLNTSTGAITVTKTAGTPFSPSAIIDTTIATNISSGLLAVARGGSGAGTLSGILFGNGTSPFTAATATNVVNLFSGCSGIQYLGADNACHAPAGTPQPYVTNATTSPQTILQATHLQGINPIVNCFDGAISAGATTGVATGCGWQKNAAGDVIVSWAGTTVASIEVLAAGPGSGGGGGSGTVTSVTSSLPLTGSGTTVVALACPTCATAAAALTSGRLLVGGAGQAIGLGNLSGDGTTANNTVLTLNPSVNPNIGVCGDSLHVSQITLNGKGLATGCVPIAISGGGGGGSTPYVTNATTSPQTITASTHGQGINPIVNCFSGVVTSGATTGISSGCSWQKTLIGDVQVAWSGTTVGSIEVLAAGPGPVGSGVASVGLLLPTSVFALSGTPVTSSGTLTGTFINQAANQFFVGPCTGGPATPAFRGLCAADIAVLGTLTNNTTGNAATATAFATSPTTCSNQWSFGIAANGNSLCSDINRVNGVLLSGLTNGLLKITGGVPSTAISSTDYAPATFGAAPLKGNGTGGFSLVVSADIGALGTLTNNTSGNAATATNLAATPGLCFGGFAPRGIAPNGDALFCQAIGGGGGGVTTFNTRAGAVTLLAADVNGVGAITNNTSGNAGSATGLAVAPSTCAVGFAPRGIFQNGDAFSCQAIGGGGTPGGSAGQTQFNSFGSFGGYTMSGDATINTTTGVITLATKNSGPGLCGDSTHVCQVTTDAQGRVTLQSPVAISGSGGGVTAFNTRTGAVTLLAADVNSVGAITNSTSGNAATSTALAATPSLCSTGFAPTGILANGNATACAAIGGGGGGIGGGGTTNKVAKFTASTTIGDSLTTDNGTVSNVGGLLAANIDTNHAFCASNGTFASCGSLPSIGWNTSIPSGMWVGSNIPTGHPSGAFGEYHFNAANGNSLVYGANNELQLGASQSANGFVIVATLSNFSTTSGGAGAGLYGEIQCNGCVTGGAGISSEAHMQTPPSNTEIYSETSQCGSAASGRVPTEVGQGHSCTNMLSITGFQTDFTAVITTTTTSGTTVSSTGNPFNSGMCHGGSGCTGATSILVGLWIVNDNSLANRLPYVITAFTDSNHVTVNRNTSTQTNQVTYLGWNNTASNDLVNTVGFTQVGARVRENGTGEFGIAQQWIAGASAHPNKIQLINAPTGNTNAGFYNGIEFWRGALGPDLTMPMVSAVNGYQMAEIRSDMTFNGSYAQGFLDIYTDQGSTLVKNARFDSNGLNLSVIPTSAGSGGLYVCIDSAGQMYKKSACP